MAAACGECDGPCFHATFNLNTSGGWVVGPHFGAFSCTQIHQSGVQRKATTAYSANMVSPLIMEAMRVNPKAKTKDLKALVQNNLNLPVTDTLLRAAMSKATKQIAGELLDTSTQPSLLLHGHPSHRCRLRLLTGTLTEEMELLPVLVQALNDDGHQCNLITVNSTEMVELMLQIGKGDHEARMKRTSDKTVFDADAYLNEYPEINEDKTYVLGFAFTPSTTLAVNKLADVDPHCNRPFHPIYIADFGHLQGAMKGVYGVAGRLDADNHWFPSADLMILANESGSTWGELLNMVKETDPHLDQFDATLLADGDKGMMSAVDKLGCLEYFICAYHRGKTVSMTPGCGSATKHIYDKMVHAAQPTMQELEKQLSSKARAYLAKTKDYNQYMSAAACAGRCMHNNYTSNAAESMQHANNHANTRIVALRRPLQTARGAKASL